MATVAQIQKDVNAFFGLSSTLATGTEDQKKQIKSFEYILQLAGMTNTNISRWDIVSLFG